MHLLLVVFTALSGLTMTVVSIINLPAPTGLLSAVTFNSIPVQFHRVDSIGLDGVVEAYELSYRSIYDPHW